MFALTLDVLKKPDGSGDYVALGLPVYMKYTNYGFESLSVQTDPQAPATGNLGSFNINGTLSMQGQVEVLGALTGPVCSGSRSLVFGLTGQCKKLMLGLSLS